MDINLDNSDDENKNIKTKKFHLYKNEEFVLEFKIKLHDPLDMTSTLSNEDIKKKPVPERRRKIRRRGRKQRWNRKKDHTKKKNYKYKKAQKNFLEEVKTGKDLSNSSYMSTEGNNLSSIKTENSLEQHESSPKQVLRVKSLAELEDPSISQKRTVVPNPHVQRKLVHFVKTTNSSDNVAQKFVLSTSSTGVQYLTPLNPELHDQGPKKFIVINKSPITQPPTSTIQPTSSQQEDSIMPTVPAKLKILKTQPTLTPVQVSKEQSIPAKLNILKMKSVEAGQKISKTREVQKAPMFSDEEEVESHKCAHCKLTFPTQTGLVEHLQIIKLQCHSCEEVFKSISELKIHLKQVHKIRGYKCSNCNFFGTSMWDLKLHQSRDHCQEYLHPCEECDKVFSNSGALKKHVRQVHEVSSASNLLCEVCGKGFKNTYTLERHIECVHENIKFSCNQCDKILYSKVTFARHLRWHSNKEKIVCELCGKTFNIQFDLQVHMRQHTGEKPYQCSICSKAFAKRTTLRQHLLTHSGKRPYVCDICGRSFTQKPGLTGHRKSHPGDLPPMPKLFIDEILKNLPERAFQNLGQRKNVISEAAENTGENDDEGTSKEKDIDEEKEEENNDEENNDEEKRSEKKVKAKTKKVKKEKKNSDSDEWTLDILLP